ncbi:hypothetical protein [Cyanobium sp. Morenito 9A2]|uniref:hypothetical protein n=1 Tax=Cyanobium sp. Morenito 9A2 TaxID=2823718 RepID=UPI0020CDC60E|nr:hypothetical protein [Cyanobium sp. Morenito 9A2]MCP9849215.1 hypothetical protein [Cyanobium sp. Morenito 9A2]
MSREVRDRALPFTGGSDRWDRGPAGQIITDEFFWAVEPPPGGDGLLSLWSSGAWLRRPAKVWSGGAWVEKPAKCWSGSDWLLT